MAHNNTEPTTIDIDAVRRDLQRVDDLERSIATLLGGARTLAQSNLNAALARLGRTVPALLERLDRYEAESDRITAVLARTGDSNIANARRALEQFWPLLNAVTDGRDGRGRSLTGPDLSPVARLVGAAGTLASYMATVLAAYDSNARDTCALLIEVLGARRQGQVDVSVYLALPPAEREVARKRVQQRADEAAQAWATLLAAEVSAVVRAKFPTAAAVVFRAAVDSFDNLLVRVDDGAGRVLWADDDPDTFAEPDDPADQWAEQADRLLTDALHVHAETVTRDKAGGLPPGNFRLTFPPTA